MEENLAFADRSQPGLLSAEELATVARVRDLYRELSPIPCTACRYCMPCPQGVAIPEILELRNDAQMYGDLARQRMVVRLLLRRASVPSAARPAASARRSALRASP